MGSMVCGKDSTTTAHTSIVNDTRTNGEIAAIKFGRTAVGEIGRRAIHSHRENRQQASRQKLGSMKGPESLPDRGPQYRWNRWDRRGIEEPNWSPPYQRSFSLGDNSLKVP